MNTNGSSLKNEMQVSKITLPFLTNHPHFVTFWTLQAVALQVPINQESLLMIPMPNSAYTLKNTLSKGSGWGKEILLWSFE